MAVTPREKTSMLRRVRGRSQREKESCHPLAVPPLRSLEGGRPHLCAIGLENELTSAADRTNASRRRSLFRSLGAFGDFECNDSITMSAPRPE
jgi:hypothetical protein